MPEVCGLTDFRHFVFYGYISRLPSQTEISEVTATEQKPELNMDSNVKAGGNIIRLDNVINSIGIEYNFPVGEYMGSS